MPDSAAPFIVAVCATFSLAIFVVGSLSVLAHVSVQNRPD